MARKKSRYRCSLRLDIISADRTSLFDELLHFPAELGDINVSRIGDGRAVSPSAFSTPGEGQSSQNLSIQVVQDPAYPNVLVFGYEECGDPSASFHWLRNFPLESKISTRWLSRSVT